METPEKRSYRPSREDSGRLWLIGFGGLLVIVFAIFWPRHRPASNPTSSRNEVKPRLPSAASGIGIVPGRFRNGSGAAAPGPTAEEIVTTKVTQFAYNRRKVTRAMAEHFKVSVPVEVERFFEAVAAGQWEELNARFQTLQQLRQGGEHAEVLRTLWGPILETLLIAESAHDWPAQRLLDYGNSILGSLRPGMIYVGGTDPGRGIPTLLNETSEGEHHIVITQNGLADSSYQQYINFLYKDQMAEITPEESQRAFTEYLTDAQKRLAHDLEFPNEPKQVRPGEEIHLVDSSVPANPPGPGVWSFSSGGIEASGQVAVMSVNERLLQIIMDKNPDRAFALEESFPLESTYPGATVLGPLMELRAAGENPVTTETAAQAVDYWRQIEQDLSLDAETGTDLPQRTYSKMAAAQAALLAEHKHPAEAEQGYRIAIDICPYNPEAVFNFTRMLVVQNRWQDALAVAEAAVSVAPENAQFQTLRNQLRQGQNER